MMSSTCVDDNEVVTTSSQVDLNESYIQRICDCGCSKLVIPYHLREEDLWVSVITRPGQDTVGFRISFGDGKPPMHGWKPVTGKQSVLT